jgi:hypothetical protein
LNKTKRLAQFFQETGRPVMGAIQPETPEDLARFAAVSARYEYWNATPEENVTVGIHVKTELLDENDSLQRHSFLQDR